MESSWLDDLEEKVRLATERLHQLADENRKLKERVAELEGSEEGPDWEAEKKSIRDRVEKLAAGLESLLDEA